MCSEVVDPTELKDVPSVIRQFQDVNNTELRSTAKSLKNGKSVFSAYVKHAMECKEFTLEMVKLFKAI